MKTTNILPHENFPLYGNFNESMCNSRHLYNIVHPLLYGYTHTHTLPTHTHTHIGDDPSCQVVTMVAKGVKLFVGTSGGVVGVFDSESVELLNVFSWHKEKVRTLLVMPKEMEACICNEIPFNNLESEHQNGVSKGHKFQRGMSAFAYLENQHCIHNDEPDAVMLMSIGNGRRKYQVSEQSKQERIKIFNDTQHSIGRRPTSMDKLGEDIVLLQWRS